MSIFHEGLFLFGGGLVVGSGLMFGGRPPSQSNCGNEFDAYVNRVVEEPFHFADSRSVNDLWKNRRFRLYVSPDETRQGKVVGWEQSRPRHSPRTRWELSVELEGLDKGDSVEVQDSPKAHRGKHGIVVKRQLDKVKIKLEQEELQFITVDIKNLKALPTTWRVNRMNVNGGGTLHRCGAFDNEKLFSLEWIDPPIPVIRLDDGVKRVTCPTCRAIEPTEQAFSDLSADTSKSDDQLCCPVCTENKPCRILQCDHQVCHDCWKQWRYSATSEIPSSVSEPDLDKDLLQRARDRNCQRFRYWLPHTMGGTATKADGRRKSTQEEIVLAEQRAQELILELLEELSDEVEDGVEDEGLVLLWRKLLLMSVDLLACDAAMDRFVASLSSIAAVEIVMQVVQARAQELAGSPKYSVEEYTECMHCCCCSRIAELYQEAENYESATFWSERALIHATNVVDKQSDDDLRFEGQVRRQFFKLGNAHREAGRLIKAYECYRKASDGFSGFLYTCHEEMEQWTGTSGNLTPGC